MTKDLSLGWTYDAEGRRVAKLGSGGAVASAYLLGLGGEQVTELNGAGQWVHSNVYAGGKLLATYEGPAGTATAGYHFHLTDWLGTKRMQTNASGVSEETCTSYPFGDGLSCSGPSADATEQHFTGKERDAESGLDYFFARYYSSDLARFMTPDWAAKPTAVPYAMFGDPQSLNLYAYVLNNPMGKADEDGHCGGQNNAPCCDVNVTAKVNGQPTFQKNVEMSDGSRNSGEFGGHLVQTVTTKSGAAIPGVGVTEKNSYVLTKNGQVQDSTLKEGTAQTNAQGQVGDKIDISLPTDGTKATNNTIKQDFTQNTWQLTDTQTLTLTLPGGATCSATSTRTLTNEDSDGDASSSYTLTTTQPVVTPPAAPGPSVSAPTPTQ